MLKQSVVPSRNQQPNPFVIAGRWCGIQATDVAKEAGRGGLSQTCSSHCRSGESWMPMENGMRRAMWDFKSKLAPLLRTPRLVVRKIPCLSGAEVRDLDLPPILLYSLPSRSVRTALRWSLRACLIGSRRELCEA